MAAEPLIDAGDLHDALQENACVAVDCRFDLSNPAAGRDAYLRGHIPGAPYAHLEEDLSAAPGPHDGRHPLPDPAALAARLGELGISPETRVVAYDDAGGAIAARLWWLLRWIGHDRSAVLDGGLRAWLDAGFELETGAVHRQPASYPLRRVHRDRVVATEDVPREQTAGRILADARAPERFLGRHEPIDPVAGHVPGAVNYPFQRSLDGSGRFVEAPELRRRLEAALGTAEAERVVAMCGSGVTACHLLLALEAAGLGSGRLYAGSWSEWIRDPARPVERG